MYVAGSLCIVGQIEFVKKFNGSLCSKTQDLDDHRSLGWGGTQTSQLHNMDSLEPYWELKGVIIDAILLVLIVVGSS
jgi:hypothetical protein